MSDDYNKELCDERHSELTGKMKDVRDDIRELFNRMRALEIRVAVIVAIGTIAGPFVKDWIFPGPKAQAQTVQEVSK